MKNIRKLGVAAASFLYCLGGLSPVMADDTEIYLGGGVGSAGGAPNVLMLIDNSGSMKWKMYTTYPAGHPRAGQTVPPSSGSTPTNPDDSRGAHMKEAVKRILNVLNGDIRVGIASYNSDSQGGRIRYPVRRLDDFVSSGNTESRKFIVGASADDATQAGSSGTALVTGQTTLGIGNEAVTTVTARAVGGGGNPSAVAYECSNNNTNSTTNIRLGPDAAFLGAAENVSPYSNCATSLGIWFNNTDLQLPPGATIVSAELVLTHNNSSRADGRQNDNGSFNATLSFENKSSLRPPQYGSGSSTANNPRTNPRTYYAASSTTYAPINVSIGGSDLTAGGSKTIDVTDWIQAQVNNGSWDNNGNTRSTLAFRLVGPSSYSSSSKNSRIIDTRAAGNPPRLVVKYATVSTATLPNYTGLRFTSVDIPRNAVITSAQLEFTADGNSSGPAGVWEIAMDPAINALPLSTTNHLDSLRWTGGPAPVTYTPTNWTDGTVYGINVTSLVQAQVNKSTYCGGDFAFRIRDLAPIGTSSKRYAHSYDDTAAPATQWPRLNVTYTLPAAGNTCINLQRVVGVGRSSDDGQQVGTNQTLLAETVDLKSGTLVGLRFGDVGVPQGATVSSAKLKVKARATVTSYGTITVKAAKVADLDSFSDTNKIGNLPLTTAAVSWSPTSWVQDTLIESPSLTSIVQEVVDQPTWARGNGMALVLQGSLTGSTFPKFYQVDLGASAAPTLEIQYQSANPDDGRRTVRTDLLDIIKTYDFNTNTPLNESYYESALYMMGNAALNGRASEWPDAAPSQNGSYTYISPIDGGQCQSNNIIMLTDGEPTSDEENRALGGTCTDSWTCMIKTATYLNNTGRPVTSTSDPSDKSSIKTYTIGFGPDVANTDLPAVAAAGGGDFFYATNTDSLVSSFQDIFVRIADTNGTMASPGVAVNQLNRSENLDQLYYGVFKPVANKRWAGNVKRYRLGTVGGALAIVDATGAAAIDPATKFFSTNARSYWSDLVDGNAADKGGAAGEQTSARTVYMDNGSAGVMAVLNPSTPPTGMDADMVNWVRGLDVDDDDADGNTTEARQSMGSPVHGQPAVVPYGTGSEDFVVFAATNDGMLHSINVADGSENWSWMPSDLIGNISMLRTNPAISAGGMPKYGLDGNWSFVLAGTTRLLVGGMRQGGSNIYAIELGNSRTDAPKLKWVVKPSTAGFGRLGFTWSQPVQARVRVAGTTKDVLVFGGGLDYATYESNGPTQVAPGSDLGNAIYMVDALTGELVWSASSAGTGGGAGAYTVASGMTYSIPGSVRAVDKGSDSLADHIYFGDTGGQIWRVDLDNTSAAPALVKRLVLLAKLGVAEQATATKINDRRFYETPAVEYLRDSAGALYAGVAIGSGNRNWPRSDRGAQDRFYMIRDYDAARFDILRADQMTAAGDGLGTVPDLVTYSAPLRTTDLADLSTVTGSAANTALTNKYGWYINLGGTGRTGEKVLSSAFIYSRRDTTTGALTPVVGFNTFLPDLVTADGCSLVSGGTTIYTMTASNAGPVDNLDGVSGLTVTDRRQDGVNNGITGSDVTLIRNGQLIRVSGTSARVDGDLPTLGNQMLRTRWYDKRQ